MVLWFYLKVHTSTQSDIDEGRNFLKYGHLEEEIGKFLDFYEETLTIWF